MLGKQSGNNSQMVLPFAFPLPFVILLHPFVQPFLHLVQKVRAALVLASLHIRIGTATIPDVYAEQCAHESRQLVNGCFPSFRQPISFSPYTISTSSMALPVHL